jgi:hypothetical protein
MNENVDLERLSIHEASHAVTTKLFEDDLHLQYLTIDSEKFKEAAVTGADICGTIGVELTGSPAPSVAVVSLAGIVGEQIWKDGIANVQMKKKAIIDNPNILDGLLSGGDFDIFQQNSAVHAHRYGGDKKYQDLCFDVLLDFLCAESVWSVVKLVSEEVLKKDDLTLSQEELEAIFQTDGYSEFVKNNKERLLKQFDPQPDKDPFKQQLRDSLSESDVDIF